MKISWISNNQLLNQTRYCAARITVRFSLDPREIANAEIRDYNIIPRENIARRFALISNLRENKNHFY